MSNNYRAEILVNGLVQGVGFRYFVYTKATTLGLKGYTKNLFTGEVFTVVEGEKYLIEELFKLIKMGPSHSRVKNANIEWSKYKDEFSNFDIRR